MNSKIKIFSGLLQLLTIVLFLIIILGLSLLIVFPLWSLATSNKELYSQIVLITSGSLISLFILYRIVRSIFKTGFKQFCKTALWPKTKSILKILGTLSLVVITINMFAYSIIIGIIAALMSVFILGFFKFALKK